MSEEPKPEAAGAAKKKSNLPLIIGGAVLVLAAAGGGAYWFLRGKAVEAKEAKGEHEEAAAEDKEPQGVVPLEPFVVNLADQDATRFLRLTLKLVLPEEQATSMEKKEVEKARIRSAVLELLAQQTADHLVTPEGKGELKKEIAERAHQSMKGLHVTDVLFSEFVVQF